MFQFNNLISYDDDIVMFLRYPSKKYFDKNSGTLHQLFFNSAGLHVRFFYIKIKKKMS